MTLVVPSGYEPGTPIGVLVGMHGRGAGPEGFVNKEACQDLADELKMAIVGVSGRYPGEGGRTSGQRTRWRTPPISAVPLPD